MANSCGLWPAATLVMVVDLLLAVDAHVVMTAGITLFVTVGVTYLFYPAVVTAYTTQRRSPPRVRHLTNVPVPSTLPAVLSLVVPCYNEEERLPTMLQETTSFLDSPNGAACLVRLATLGSDAAGQPPSLRVEWILVDDGSSDDTCRVIQDFVDASSVSLSCNSNTTYTLLQLPHNCGKGAAIRTGMLHTSGAFALMVDADGATDFASGLAALVQCLETNCRGDSVAHSVVVVGSRAQVATTNRSWVRNLLMHGFHVCVKLLVGGQVQDTQCGFKLFAHDTIRPLFQHLHLQRWAFDTEMLYRATRCGYAIHEVPVHWHEVPGSKLDNGGPLQLALVAMSMLRDMLCVRLCYTLGIWSIHDKSASSRDEAVTAAINKNSAVTMASATAAGTLASNNK